MRAAASWSSSIRAAAGRPRPRTSTTRSGPGRTRSSCSRSSTCCSPRGSRRPGGWPSLTDGIDAVARAGAAVHARGGRAAHTGIARRRHPAHGARAGGRRVRRRLRPHRDDDAGLRHARLVAGRRAQRPHRQPRPPGRRDVHARRGGRSATRPARRAAAAACELGRWHTRVRGLPGVARRAARRGAGRGDRHAGRGRLRALVTLAGNPARSRAELRPGRARARRGSTCSSRSTSTSTRPRATRDVILPAPSPLQHSHYDLALYQLAVRNVAHYSPPVLAPDPAVPAEWETLLRLAAVAAGQAAPDDVAPLDERVAGELAQRAAGAGAGAPALLAATAHRSGPERLLDILLRSGPYDAHARRPGGGAARDRPRPADAAAPGGAAHAERPDRARAAGDRGRRARGCARRSPRPPATGWCWSAAASCAPTTRGCTTCRGSSRGPSGARCRCTRTTPRGSRWPTARRARVSGRAGSVEAPVEVTDAIRPGVVSLPHGWGHDADGARLGVAADARRRQQQRARRRGAASTCPRATRCSTGSR